MFLALAPIERSAGSDEIAEIGLRELQTWPGALLLIGAASAVGLPGTWGFWPRRWLIDALLESSPWAVAPLLAGSSRAGAGVRAGAGGVLAARAGRAR
ncbi:MAG: hypothetical protein U0Z44_16390 [Kouleothrix sp.]